MEGPASKKRGSSAFSLGARIPKKSKVPALASLVSVGGFNSDGSPSKRVLVTREKLRAGLHDRRGLLDLGGSSTNALDSLLFGAKVLSIPGFLSGKNISDIENNNVDGDAT